MSAEAVSPSTAPPGSRVTAALRDGAPRPWLSAHADEVLAVLLLTWGVVESLTLRIRHGPLAANLLVVFAASALVLVRPRWPLPFVATTLSLALISTIWLTNTERENWTIYMLFVPGYTVAAYEELPRAVWGLALAVSGPLALDCFRGHLFVNAVFTTIMATTAWATGRAMRHRRLLQIELEQRASRLMAEREDRARLAVADERTRIARELHAVVANSVSAMVVQAETAQRLLEQGSPDADATMAAIEHTGRQALAEMRRILGVLRRTGEDPELAPQPGVGQLHRLAEAARARGRDVQLRVEGDPGPLPVAVDLGLYRILEAALETTDAGSMANVEVTLRFAEHDVELELETDGPAFAGWPTIAMRERVALCEGALTVEPDATGRRRLTVELPRAFEGVLA